MWGSEATPLSGVAEMDERRSRKLDEESVRVADASVRRASIIARGAECECESEAGKGMEGGKGGTRRGTRRRGKRGINLQQRNV